MKIQVISGSPGDVAAGIAACGGVQFVTVHSNCLADITALQLVAGDAAFHGATSCLGAMTQTTSTAPVAAFVLQDEAGDYGSALRALGDDPKAAGHAATIAALQAADRAGEVPDLVWISSAPGAEEAVLEGVQSVTGSDVPIIGGSAADNSVEGNWFVFDAEQKEQNGVIVSVLFCSGTVSFAYQNGYVPTAHSGTVTKATGRTVHEIDHRPALDVYREWTGGAVAQPEHPTETSAILSDSTLHPLGREIMHVGAVPYYLLAHPAGARANGDIDLFALVEEGEVLTQMSGTIEGLTSRAGRVADLALTAGRIPAAEVKGALMIYCGGCMLTVQDTLGEVVDGVNAALKGAPFLGAFTFGEQGAIVGSGNRHGNLMISCIVFS